MTALTADRVNTQTAVKRLRMTLAAGEKAYKGSQIAVTLGVGTCVVVTATTGLFVLGKACAAVDATSAAKTIEIELAEEITAFWQNNHNSGTVAATDVGYLCYWQDDQTVTMTSTGRAIAGRVLAVDAIKGVLIQELGIGAEYATAIAATMRLATGATLAFTSGACTMTSVTSGALYDVPATSEASTITLPAASAYGTWAVFQADGAANDFTVKFACATLGDITSKCPAGVPFQVIAVKGTDGWHATVTIDGRKPIDLGDLPAPVGGDITVPAAAIVHGAVYTLPDLAADSTVTLAVTGVLDGTQITVVADGGQGAYTTTYRYGTTAISAAATESKAHSAVLTKYGTVWVCNLTVSP